MLANLKVLTAKMIDNYFNVRNFRGKEFQGLEFLGNILVNIKATRSLEVSQRENKFRDFRCFSSLQSRKNIPRKFQPVFFLKTNALNSLYGVFLYLSETS